jgi:hypothetical protein
VCSTGKPNTYQSSCGWLSLHQSSSNKPADVHADRQHSVAVNSPLTMNYERGDGEMCAAQSLFARSPARGERDTVCD